MEKVEFLLEEIQDSPYLYPYEKIELLLEEIQDSPCFDEYFKLGAKYMAEKCKEILKEEDIII